MSEEQDRHTDDLEIYIPSGPRLGDVVVEVDGVSKSFGDTVLFEQVSFSLPKGGIVGVIGPNGAGKSTLFKIIAGFEKSDSGALRLGETVKLGYVDQGRVLDDNVNVWECITGGKETVALGKMEVNSRGYVSRFNFSGSDQQKKVKGFVGWRAKSCTFGSYAQRRSEFVAAR